MSATRDSKPPHAKFAEKLIQQTVKTLADCMVKTKSDPPGCSASEAAEFVVLYNLFMMAAHRYGIDGYERVLANATEIAKILKEEG